MTRTLTVMNTTADAGTAPVGSLSGQVATRVRMLMAGQRKSNKELAALLHVSERSAIRRRQGTFPLSLAEIEQIAEWLDVDPLSLLSGLNFEAVSR